MLKPDNRAGNEAVGKMPRLLRLVGLHMLPKAKYSRVVFACCCPSALPRSSLVMMRYAEESGEVQEYGVEEVGQLPFRT